MTTINDEAVKSVQAQIDWLEAEVARLKDVVRVQDERDGAITARCEIVPDNDGPRFIVTCPSDDERKIMHACFAAFGSIIFSGITSSIEKIIPGKSLQDAMREFYGRDEDGEKAGG